MAAAYYGWVGPLDLVAWEQGNVVLSPQVVEEERESGKVYIAHLLLPAGTGALYVAGHQIRHPAFVKHKPAGVVGEDEVMMLQ